MLKKVLEGFMGCVKQLVSLISRHCRAGGGGFSQKPTISREEPPVKPLFIRFTPPYFLDPPHFSQGSVVPDLLC